MKFNFLMLALMMLCGSAVYAETVTINTSCGKTVKIDSNDYTSSAEMVMDAWAIDKAICKSK
jgi:hypothetical protein